MSELSEVDRKQALQLSRQQRVNNQHTSSDRQTITNTNVLAALGHVLPRLINFNDILKRGITKFQF